MLKSLLIASISIVYVLSFYDIFDANAQSNARKKHSEAKYDLGKSQPLESSSIVSQSDMKGIRQAIEEHFGEKNDRQNPTINQESRKYKQVGVNQTIEDSTRTLGCTFHEVKSLKIVSLYGSDAMLEAEIIETEYLASRLSDSPLQWSFKKQPRFHKQAYFINRTDIRLKKVRNRWRLSSVGNSGPMYKEP